MTRPPLNRLEVLTLISLALNSLLLIVVIFIAVTLMTGRVKTKPSVLPFSHITTLDLIAVKTNIIIAQKPNVVVTIYSEGTITDYAKTVLARAEIYRKGG